MHRGLQVHEFGKASDAAQDDALPPIAQNDAVTITPVMLRPAAQEAGVLRSYHVK